MLTKKKVKSGLEWACTRQNVFPSDGKRTEYFKEVLTNIYVPFYYPYPYLTLVTCCSDGSRHLFRQLICYWNIAFHRWTYFNETDNVRESKVLILASSHTLISKVLKWGNCVNPNLGFEDGLFSSEIHTPNLLFPIFQTRIVSNTPDQNNTDNSAFSNIDACDDPIQCSFYDWWPLQWQENPTS